MTSPSSTRRLALLAAFASSVWLVACGGSGGDDGGGTSSVRTINLASGLPSIDVAIGGNKLFNGITSGTLANYASVEANAYTVNVNAAGNASALSTGTYSFSKDGHFTAVVWGASTSPVVTLLPEDYATSEIGAGNTRVRMLNATTETGALDIYLTTANADITSTAATQSSVTPGSTGLTGFREIPAGTYRLRVTGVNRPDDLRLDIPAVTLEALKYATLVLTPGAGGVLVNGTLIGQQTAAIAATNTKARVRLVASVDAGGAVAATVGSTTLSQGLISPAILGSYALIDAGPAVNLAVRVNGNSVLSAPTAFVAGSDYTLMAYGPTAGAQVTISADDNRLPISTSRTKIRVVNGMTSIGPVTLLVDYGAVSGSSSVAPGTVSAYSQVASNSGAQIQVTSAGGDAYITTRTNGDVLLGQGVYTVFILSGKNSPDGTPVATGTLRNERP